MGSYNYAGGLRGYEFYNQPFELIDWQEKIIRDIFGTIRADGYKQFNTAYIEISKKSGKSELAAAESHLLNNGKTYIACARGQIIKIATRIPCRISILLALRNLF